MFIGLILIGLAVWVVASAEDPVRGDTPASAEPIVVLLPEPVNPLGEAEPEGLRFEWLWSGPEVLWELVLLDAGMEVLATVRDIRGTSLEPRGVLQDHLRRGGRFHWFVAYSSDGQTYRSLPVPLVLPLRVPTSR